MRSLLLLSYKQKLNSGYISRLSNVYSLIILLFAFVTVLSFAVSNYVTQKLTIDLSPDDMATLSGEEIENASSLSEITVKKGDTLSKIFASQQMTQVEIANITKAIKESKIDFAIKPGQVITFDYAVSDKENAQNALNEYLLKEINISIDKTRNIVISKVAGNFQIKDIIVPLKRMFVKHNVQINNSFITALSSIGVSAANIQELVKAYSYEVDFQRQIKSGDTISVLCEKFYTEEGDFAHNGKVLYSSLNLSGSKHNIYWFNDTKNKVAQYFSESGKSIKKSLLRTPINVARISSHYGSRHHPVLGYTKMHKGVDFAAPTGTPILAAGDGVVTEANFVGAYGNLVKIKHSASLTTAYAHASRFASGIKRGSRIKQGQVIAYVGTTGRTTGPHCHFEVIINGKNVNPMSVQSTPGVELKNEALRAFVNHKKILQNYTQKLPENEPLELTNLGV